MNFTCPRSCPAAGERWCRFRAVTDTLGPARVNSHVAHIDLEIRDLGTLALACKRLGLEFRKGQQTYRWYGKYMGDSPLPEGMTAEDLGKCIHAIAIPGDDKAYEIGVIQKPNGDYGLVWDFWNHGMGIEDVAGKDCGKLVAEYTFTLAEQAAKVQGWLCERTVDGLVVHHPSGGVLTITAGGTLDASGFVGQGCHSAIMELGLPLDALTAKPENAQVVAQAQVAGR